MMPDAYDDKQGKQNKAEQQDDLEQLLVQGITLQDVRGDRPTPSLIVGGTITAPNDEEDDVPDAPIDGDLQGAIAFFAEASQDMATATVELSLGRHFACADFCNQAVEKATQSIAMLRFGHRIAYNHDLRALGQAVDAPLAIQDALAVLTPFHPEAFYMDTPPEEADEVISAEQASSYIQTARTVMRWVRNMVLFFNPLNG